VSIRVLIADDQKMVRAGFAMILSAQDDIEVVAECADGVEALEAARRLRPDVALLDIRMPRLDGLEVARRLAAIEDNPTRVVVVTTFDLDEYVHAALTGGAVGFLLKDAGPALLVEAVRAATADESLISPAVTTRLLRTLSPGPAARTTRTPRHALTPRELDVVRLVARGRTNAEIADALFLSLSTVKTHLGAVQGKLGARNRVEIAAWVWESGAVPAE
jgi:DNA-binding NarL/FixJ family response regulator